MIGWKREKIKIESDKLLLVEGKDEVSFFTSYLKYLNISGVQMLDIAGKDQFKNKIPALLNLPEFERVAKYAIIRDADDSETDAFKSILDILTKYKQPTPGKTGSFKIRGDLSVGIFVMPGNDEVGMLETLCLQTVAEKPLMQKVEDYVNSARELLENKKDNYNIHKAKIQTYLAGMPEIVNSLGLGAKKGYWNFEHKSLEKLKEFITELAK